MDQQVYPKENVGEFMNAHFISVKAQIDTTQSDPEQVRNWYGDAHTISEQYKVKSFPTFLFFSPEGKIVHRFTEALRDTDFIKLAKNALNPETQFYTLLERYQHGERNCLKMPYLANTARSIDENDLANRIAREYIDYLNIREDRELYSRKNLEFTVGFIRLWSTNDKVFSLFYGHGDSVDRIMGSKGLAGNVTRYVITNNEINPRLWPGGKAIEGKPDWEKLASTIERKYNKEDAEKIILDARLRWYKEKMDWRDLTRYTVLKIEKYGLDTAGLAKYLTNNILYDVVFKHSENPEEIKKAIGWMEIIVNSTQDNANLLDTYANLLYKAGRMRDALVWEEKAVKLDPDRSDIRTTLEKMKKRQPTWQ
jgi:hypothetical protein